MAQILIVDEFGPIASLGLRRLVEEIGFDVTLQKADDIMTAIVKLMPAAVVLNLDTEDGARVAHSMTSTFPAVTVVLCSPERSILQVYPRFHHGESYLSPLTPDLLSKAVSS